MDSHNLYNGLIEQTKKKKMFQCNRNKTLKNEIINTHDMESTFEYFYDFYFFLVIVAVLFFRKENEERQWILLLGILATYIFVLNAKKNFASQLRRKRNTNNYRFIIQ